MAFEFGNDFEKPLFGEASAGEFIEASDDSGAQCATGAKAAGDGNVAGDLDVERDRRNFGAPEIKFGGFPNDGRLVSRIRSRPSKRDVIVKIEGETERVEAGPEIARAGGNADGDGFHRRQGGERGEWTQFESCLVRRG